MAANSTKPATRTERRSRASGSSAAMAVCRRVTAFCRLVEAILGNRLEGLLLLVGVVILGQRPLLPGLLAMGALYLAPGRPDGLIGHLVLGLAMWTGDDHRARR